MNPNTFPAGWDDARVRRLIAEHEQLSDDELADEDDAAAEPTDGNTVITVPNSLLPAIRKLLASQSSA